MSYLEIIAWRGVCKGRGDLGWVARALKMLRCCERLGFRGSPCVPGREWSVPERANFHAPRSPSWAPGGVFSAGTDRVAVWGVLGAGVRSVGTGWRTVEPGLPRGILNRHSIFIDIRPSRVADASSPSGLAFTGPFGPTSFLILTSWPD